MDKIKVSIIMPVYNSGEYLSFAVDSILYQSLREIELILVDDGSTDGSSERCDEYASKDNRVVVIHQKNSGICNARNAALKVARGEYIGFSDHDDEYSPGQLEDNYRLITESGCDMIKFGSREILSNGNVVLKTIENKYITETYTNEHIQVDFWKIWRKRLFNCVWDCLFLRSFIETNKITFDSFYKYGGEDYDFIWKCIGHGASLRVNSGVYYNHYIRTGFSTSAKYHEYNIKMTLERPHLLLDLIRNTNIKPENDKLGYTFFFLQLILGSLTHTLAHPKCLLSIDDKVKYLSNLRNQSYVPNWLFSSSIFSIEQISSLKYVVLFLLYKWKMYGWCIRLYKVLYKRQNIK